MNDEQAVSAFSQVQFVCWREHLFVNQERKHVYGTLGVAHPDFPSKQLLVPVLNT